MDPIVKSSVIDGLPQTITYNGDNKIILIVCVQEFEDGSYTTFTQTWAYPNPTTCTISAWVAVYTAV